MKRRFTAILLTICLVIGLLPATALAASADLVVVSEKEYAVAPGITERELITNNSDFSAQQAGHIMEVELGGYADIIVGYNDYNIPAIQSGNNWGMEEPTAQAQNAETRRGVNVVGAVNGDFFNMSNGAPSGVLVMNGTEIKGGTSPCFWVDSKDQAHISANGTEMKNEAAALGVTVREAIGGNAILVQDGQRTSAGGSYGDTPNPRTVVGIKQNGTVIIYMVNGRQAPYSVGMSYGDLADIMLREGCVDALNLDGGGSSVFASQREGEPNDNGAAGLTVRCRPSDGYERSVSSCLLVVSKAEQTGIFDHATLSPSDEVYTPGSTIQFAAQGVDAGGGVADLPASGLTWSVTEGSTLGSIDGNGLFTAAAGKTGSVEVSLSYNGNVVGKTTVELQWPDTLAFTNSSVSLDFGQSSDLSFNPTWNGREVHYKEGDFAWTIVGDEELSYKATLPVETYTKPGWGGYDQELQLSITGNMGSTQAATAYYGNYLVYETFYREESREINVLSDGAIQVSETISHINANLYSHVNGSLVKENITSDVNESIDGTTYKVIGIQPTKVANFSLGKFQNNQFVADEESSLKGTIQVSLAGDPSVTGSISVIVGMEPVVLMDFEGGHTDPITGEGLSAEKYWTYHVGMSEDNGGNSLSLQERQDYRVMIRDTTGKGVQWPAGQNRLMSSSEDSRVRFGSYALQLAWDFTSIGADQVASADFGFTSMIYAHVVQPTKIGFWINVPEDRATDTSQVKMIFVGGITGITDTTVADAAKPGLENAYWDMDAEGNLTWHPHELPNGTTQYLNYYSYDSDGNITGSQLKDWAGKGWTWIEADLSGAQFPIGIQYGYTIRIVSPQNNEKQRGNILVDNLQLIYGTNTNDIYNPVIDSISETSNGMPINDNSVEFDTGSLSFEVTYSDNELTDKYATGIDVSGIQVSIDGHDYTSQAEISASSARFSATGLVNGSHTLTVKVKDVYGNESTATRTFTVNDDAGANALVSLDQPEDPPVVAGQYTLTLRNLDTTPMNQASITLRLPSAYTESWSVAAGEGYTASGTLEGNDLRLTAERAAEGTAGDVIATVTFSIPSDVREGDTFQYTLTSGSYITSANATASFSQPQVTVPLTASCTLALEGAALMNFPATLVVRDEQDKPVAGAKVYQDTGDAPATTGDSGNMLGTTGEDGTLQYTFTSAGRTTLYAVTGEGRSWNTAMVVNSISNEGPFAVQSVASADGATQRTVTWLSPIGSSLEGTAELRFIPQGGDWAEAQTVTGTTEIMAFTEANSGTALRLNTVKVDGLTPNTTYSYQVGNGSNWQDTIYTFTTASDDPEGDTNFFIFGDIQTDSTANLAAAIEKVKASSINYAFGLQTGDAIDNPTAFSNWRNYLTVLNAQNLGTIDVIHTLGNHEYYGDADGSNAGSVFALPEYESGSFYSVEYGSVYVAVVNNGGNFKAALEGVAADAANSDCTWKTIVVHEPIYGTVEELDTETRKELTAIIEGAGIDFVFTGDDHAYARTVPLKGDAETTAEEGVVYYVCGDLSGKDNEYHGDRTYFAKAIPHSEYGGMYLSVQANGAQMTITAYDYQGNLLDSYTKTKEKSACDLGQHTFNESSVYDLSTGKVKCALCNQMVSAAESGYTGMLNTASGEGQVLLVQGVLQQDGWFTWGEDMCHIAANGIIHSIVPLVDTSTCLENGRLKATCTQCGNVYWGAGTWAKGHTWDENHVCTVCNTQGIDIAQAELKVEYLYYSYTGSAIRPASSATYNGKTLVASSDRYGTDAYISYQRNTDIGVGTVTYEGRGNFYGSVSFDFTIVPASVDVVQAVDVGMNSVTLSWNAAKGAQTYLIQRQVGDTWQRIGTTADTSFTVDNLDSEAQYTFRVYCMATVDSRDYYCLSYSDPVTITTISDPTQKSETYLTQISCAVPGQELNLQMTDGVRYLYLPSSATLSALPLRFTVTGHDGAVSLTGDLGSVVLDSYEQTVDLAALASQDSDGSYLISVQLGSLSPFVVRVMHSANIPAMYLTSSDLENQGRDYVDAAKGNSTTANMKLIDTDGTVLYDGLLSQLKSRGNSTFLYYDKKSYQIKLDSKSDLLGNGENVKTWVLLAGYGDATQMHDKLFKDLAAELGMPYVPGCDWVDLYYDGEYRGTYLLSEKNSVGGTAVDIHDMEKDYEDLYPDYGNDAVAAQGINAYGQSYSYTSGLEGPEDVTGGYLLELNYNTIDEANGFHTKQEVAFNLKSPEFGSDAAVKYISEYYQEFEDAVYATDSNGNYTGYNVATGKYYYDYCDLESLVRMYLIQEFALNSDAFASSLFFYKDAGGKLYAGPVWDMEMTCGTGWDEYLAPTREFLHLRYLSEALIQIPGFKDAVKQYFNNAFLPAVQDLLGNSGKIKSYQSTLTASTTMNYTLWPYVRIGSPAVEGHFWAEGTSYNDVVDDMAQWLQERLDVLKEEWEVSQPGGDGGDTGSTGGGDTGTTGGGDTGATGGGDDNTGNAGGAGSSAGGGKVENTTNPDGSTTTTVTKPDGSKTQTTKAPNGSSSVVTTDKDGKVEAEVKLPAAVVNKAAETGEAVSLPMPAVAVTADSKNAAVVTVDLPANTTAKVEIPVADVTAGTVAVLVKADGTEEVIKTTLATENGVAITLSDGDNVKIVDNSKEFTDVPAAHWGADAVAFATSRELFNGTSGTTFSPTGDMTRAMIVTVLARYDNVDTTAGNTWYEVGAAWAVEKGVSDGANLDSTVTREQLVTMLWRLVGSPVIESSLIAYPDSASVSDWAAQAMAWAVDAGIITGTGTGALNSQGTATRVEVATMLARFVEVANR